MIRPKAPFRDRRRLAEKRLSLGVFGPILEPESKLFMIRVTLGSKGNTRLIGKSANPNPEDDDDRRGEGSIDQSLQMRNSSVSKRSIDQADQHRYDPGRHFLIACKGCFGFVGIPPPSPPQSSL
jgi:hypothetical protein